MSALITPPFDQYVAARSGALLRFAYLLCGDPHLAEDLVQEVLIKAHRRWPAIEADNPDAYVKRALVHTHISWRRRRSSSEVTASELPDQPQLDAFADRHASRDELGAMLATLSQSQRAVLVLRYFEDLDDRRIADLIGISPSTVRVHAHRGLSALRELLADRAGEAPDPAHLPELVRRGIARAARRRRVTAVTTAAIAVVVTAVLGVALPRLWPLGEPPVGPTESPTIDPSPTMSPPPVPMQTVVLPEVPGYPYEFTWVAPSYEPTKVRANVGRHLVSYGTQFDGYGIVISSEYFPLDWEPTPETSAVTVNGLPATLRTAPVRTPPDPNGFLTGPLVEVAWQQDGMWISVISAVGDLDADQALRVAEGMRPARPPAVQAELASVAIPTDWVLDQWVPDSVCATPNDAPPDPWGLISVGVCITVVTGDDYPVGVPSGLTIDGDPAEINAVHLIVHRADGRLVTIDRYYGSVPLDEVPSLGLTDDLVIAMYRGITFR